VTKPARFWLGHLWLPLAAFVAAVAVVELTGLDLALADRLYVWQGGRWAIKDQFLAAVVLHDGGRRLLILIALGLLAGAVAAPWVAPLRPYRRGFWYLLAVLALAPGLVNVLKLLTHVDCPWDLARYGGAAPYVPLFAAHPGDFAYGRCFPAAHASGGYALLGLYFFARTYAPRLRWIGLGVGLAVGGVYGFTQQLRGAHFLSHDLWALAICWFAALLLARWLMPRAVA
jgi:membrane-associated PAP2 superfamily phosphatase